MLADLAFKFLPVVASDVLAVLLDMTLRLQPALQTVVVDVADGSGALACQDERIVVGLFRAPAESALNWVVASITKSNSKDPLASKSSVTGKKASF